MEGIQPESKQQIKPYLIRKEQFEIQPEELQPYKPGDKITRVNFTNFLIYSFGISMGQAQVQILFMRWLQLHTGFDYAKTLNNFVQVGGWQRLSDKEKKQFIDIFSKVPMHNQKYGLSGNESEMQAEIEKIENFAREISQSLEPGDNEGIENMNTFAEFSVFARKKVEELRNRR